MTEIRKVSSLDLEPEVNTQLSRMMSGIVQGNDTIIEGPLAKVPDIKSKFDNWYSAMQSKIELIPELSEVEQSNQDKFGPRSIALPWEDRKGGVEAYFEKKSSNAHELSFPQGSHRLRPLSLLSAKDYIKKTTNSGLPYLRKKGAILDVAIDNFESLLNRMDPCVLFTRTQEGKKTRPVWGFPIADTINEMCYYRPLLEYQKTTGYRSAVIGPEKVDSSVTALMKYASERGLKLLSIDFSAYDTSISPELSRLCFNYIKTLFQTTYSDNIDYIMERFINIGLCTPDGIYVGEHGVPSGSTFTNEIDSLVQYIIAINYPDEKLELFQIQGDDGLYACKDPTGLMQWFENFGLNVNKDKSLISDTTAQYLQLTYNREYEFEGEYKGVYPVSRAFNRLCYPERFTDFSKDEIDGKDYFAIRAISILENCKYHPYYEEFVRFVLENDKYDLQVSEQSINNYIKYREKQDGRDINFNIYQYGDYAKGIRNFTTYKLLKSMM